MDSFSSSPSRLNRKLLCYSNPLMQKPQGYYDYISNNINSSCKELESKFKNLSFKISPHRTSRESKVMKQSRNLAFSPIHSSLSSTSFFIPKMNHAHNLVKSPMLSSKNNSDIKKALNDKDKVISQFSNLSELAMEKMKKLHSLNDSIASKLNQHETQTMTKRRTTKAEDSKSHHTLSYQSKLDSICNSTSYRSKNEAKENKKQLASIEIDRMNEEGNNYSYHRPLMYEMRSTEPKQQSNVNLDNRNYYYNEAQCELKINELKSKIIDLEKELACVKQSQRQQHQHHYHYHHPLSQSQYCTHYPRYSFT